MNTWTRLPFLIGLDGQPHVDHERAQANIDLAERARCCYLCGNTDPSSLHRRFAKLRCRDEQTCDVRYKSLPEPPIRDVRMVPKAA